MKRGKQNGRVGSADTYFITPGQSDPHNEGALMDTSKLNELSMGQKVAGGSAGLALIASFLPWYTLKDEFLGGVSFKGTSFTFGWIGAVLLLAAAGLVIAPAFGKSVGNKDITGEQIAIGVGGLGALLWAIRFIRVPAVFFDTMGRGIGLFLAAAAAAGVVAGVVMTMKEKGIAMPNADSFKALSGGVSTTAGAPSAPQNNPVEF